MNYSNSPLVTYKNLSKNMTQGRKYNIERFTPHCFVGQVSAKRGVDLFTETDNASANYVIGKSGDIGLSVEEKNRAWTSSSSENDNKAITVEIASDNFHPYRITDAAWDSLVNLAVDVCQRYNKTKLIWIPNKAQALDYKPAKNELLITVHRWFAAKACPGDYVYNRLGELADAVTAKLNIQNKLTPEQIWAIENNLFSGYGNGEYGWSDPLTRGQAAILFKKLYDMIKAS